ncbi:1175_t:CDS:2 [Entrophospora sp. SA101]|nr:1175_t:CDS:2 [Entrophospora sp. SA101]
MAHKNLFVINSIKIHFLIKKDVPNRSNIERLIKENGGEVVTNAESAYWILADTSKKQKFNSKEEEDKTMSYKIVLDSVEREVLQIPTNYKKVPIEKKAATKIIPNLKKLTQESLSHQQQKQPILKKNRSKRQQHKEQEYEEQQEYQEQEYQEHDEQETPHLRRSLRLQKIQKPSSKPQRELSKKKNVNVIGKLQSSAVLSSSPLEALTSSPSSSASASLASSLTSSLTSSPSASLTSSPAASPASLPSSSSFMITRTKTSSGSINVIIDLDDVPSPPLITQHSDQSDDNHELPSRIVEENHYVDDDNYEENYEDDVKLHSSTTTLPNKSTQLKSTKISSSSLEEQSKSSPNTTPSTIRGSPCSTKSISPLSLRSPLLLQMSSPVIQSSPVTVNNPQLPSKSLSPPHSRPRSRPCSVSPNERPIIIIENNIHNRYQNIDERDNNGVVVNEQRRGNGVFVVNGYDNNNNGSVVFRNVDNNDGDDILVLNDQVEEDRLLTQYDSDRNLKNARDFEEDDSDDFIVDFDDKRAKELLRLFA